MGIAQMFGKAIDQAGWRYVKKIANHWLRSINYKLAPTILTTLVQIRKTRVDYF